MKDIFKLTIYRLYIFRISLVTYNINIFFLFLELNEDLYIDGKFLLIN